MLVKIPSTRLISLIWSHFIPLLAIVLSLFILSMTFHQNVSHIWCTWMEKLIWHLILLCMLSISFFKLFPFLPLLMRMFCGIFKAFEWSDATHPYLKSQMTSWSCFMMFFVIRGLVGPASAGTGTIAMDPIFGSENRFHIRWMGF
jgi:hypothetical protein